MFTDSVCLWLAVGSVAWLIMTISHYRTLKALKKMRDQALHLTEEKIALWMKTITSK